MINALEGHLTNCFLEPVQATEDISAVETIFVSGRPKKLIFTLTTQTTLTKRNVEFGTGTGTSEVIDILGPVTALSKAADASGLTSWGVEWCNYCCRTPLADISPSTIVDFGTFIKTIVNSTDYSYTQSPYYGVYAYNGFEPC
jgi:hypothetical protein